MSHRRLQLADRPAGTDRKLPPRIGALHRARARSNTVDKATAMFGVYGGTPSLPVAIANDLKMPFLAIAGSPGIAKAGPWSVTLITTAEEEEVLVEAITSRPSAWRPFTSIRRRWPVLPSRLSTPSHSLRTTNFQRAASASPRP